MSRRRTGSQGPVPSRATGVVLAALGALAACSADVQQPIGYNHDLHVNKLETPCETCHPGSKKGVVATLPSISVCSDCHGDPQGNSPEEAKVVEAVRANKEIGWVRLYELPRHVYFSHRRHVDVAQVACEKCHGPMAARTRPPPAALMTLTMNDCLECHTQRGASTDCDACHR